MSSGKTKKIIPSWLNLPYRQCFFPYPWNKEHEDIICPSLVPHIGNILNSYLVIFSYNINKIMKTYGGYTMKPRLI
jgi:hypothetical protein